jgi:hypothetical protein
LGLPVRRKQTSGSRSHCSARDDRLAPNHNLPMPGELPSLFLTFACLANVRLQQPLE